MTMVSSHRSVSLSRSHFCTFVPMALPSACRSARLPSGVAISTIETPLLQKMETSPPSKQDQDVPLGTPVVTPTPVAATSSASSASAEEERTEKKMKSFKTKAKWAQVMGYSVPPRVL